ncbi:MAG: hypothetical protein M2R46_00246 [Verrucomicrobia subdivision 3 bacterium]|nr:hypothetical protein [Limisphaerales bacterium]
MPRLPMPVSLVIQGRTARIIAWSSQRTVGWRSSFGVGWNFCLRTSILGRLFPAVIGSVIMFRDKCLTSFRVGVMESCGTVGMWMRWGARRPLPPCLVIPAVDFRYLQSLEFLSNLCASRFC